MIVSTTYHFPAPRWSITRRFGFWVVDRDIELVAMFRDHADAIAWADRKARGRA